MYIQNITKLYLTAVMCESGLELGSERLDADGDIVRGVDTRGAMRTRIVNVSTHSIR
jgi:hypothetical protein